MNFMLLTTIILSAIFGFTIVEFRKMFNHTNHEIKKLNIEIEKLKLRIDMLDLIKKYTNDEKKV